MLTSSALLYIATYTFYLFYHAVVSRDLLYEDSLYIINVGWVTQIT